MFDPPGAAGAKQPRLLLPPAPSSPLRLMPRCHWGPSLPQQPVGSESIQCRIEIVQILRSEKVPRASQVSSAAAIPQKRQREIMVPSAACPLPASQVGDAEFGSDCMCCLDLKEVREQQIHLRVLEWRVPLGSRESGHGQGPAQQPLFSKKACRQAPAAASN